MSVQVDDPHFSDDTIHAFLGDEMPVEQANRVESHLDTCQICAERVTVLAAEPWGWSKVTKSLIDDDFDGHPMQKREKKVILRSSLDDAVGYEYDGTLLHRELSGWLDPTDDPDMLGRFAGYEVVGVIGHGGMGIVMKGFERTLNRYVAIKVLAPRLASNGAARKRFEREARAAAAVIHDNVIAIHRVDQWHGLPFLVMPYVAGESLQQRIDRVGPLDTDAILRIGQQVAAGLGAAHAQGLVHRDIKPANILLDQGVERVTITDFGLARASDDAPITRTGFVTGTPMFMSPEQASAEPIDHRSDVFSLGSVMYAMATGVSPFQADENHSLLRKICSESAPGVREKEESVPEWLAELIDWCHKKTPDERPQSAREIEHYLGEWLAHLKQPHRVSQPARIVIPATAKCNRPPRWPSSKTLTAMGGFLFLLAGILFILEAGNGTIRIETNSDRDVPIVIKQGDKVVKHLTVPRDGASSHLKAGNYIIEVKGGDTRFDIKGDEVNLSRGETWIAKVVLQTEHHSRISVVSPCTGKINRIGDGVGENRHVKKGDLITEITPLDSREQEKDESELAALKNRIQSAEITLESNLRTLEATTKISDALKVQKAGHEQVHLQIAKSRQRLKQSAEETAFAAEQRLTASKAAFETLREDFGRKKLLFDQNLISQLKLQDAERKFKEAEARVFNADSEAKAASHALSLDEGKQREQQAKLEVDRVTTDLAKVEKEIVTVENDVNNVRRFLSQSKNTLLELQAKIAHIERYRIVAPQDGILQGVKHLSVGHTVKQGAVICSIVVVEDSESVQSSRNEMKVSTDTVSPPDDFEDEKDSVLEVIRSMENHSREGRHREWLNSVEDEEVERLAGFALIGRAQAKLQQVMLGELVDKIAEADPQIAGMQKMLATTDPLFRTTPSQEATAAFNLLTAIVQTQMMLQVGGEPENDADLDNFRSQIQGIASFSQLLRNASGVLSDPREFIAVLKECNPSMTDRSNLPAPAGQWDIVVDGASATATNASEVDENAQSFSHLELRRTLGGEWRIHKLFKEEELQAIMRLLTGLAVENDAEKHSDKVEPAE